MLRIEVEIVPEVKPFWPTIPGDDPARGLHWGPTEASEKLAHAQFKRYWAPSESQAREA